MDVGKLFKLPEVPKSAVTKRKWAEPTTAEVLKHAQGLAEQHQEQHEPAAAGPSRPRKSARVDDEDDADGDGDGTGAPEQDETYFFEDDDEENGRFFGGGLTDQQTKILDIMDRSDRNGDANTNPDSVVSLSSIRKQVLRFEKSISKNAEMRVKYATDPARFIDSEADLDAELKSLVVLTTNPTLLYPEFVKLGAVASLVGLLSHDNEDIVAAAIEVLEEITDDDVIEQTAQDYDAEDQERHRQQREAATRALDTLVDALLEQNGLELLVANLSRFNDVLDPKLHESQAAPRRAQIDNDAQAIYHTLSTLENLVTFRTALSETLVSKTGLLRWILARITRKAPFDQNTGYAAELLAILTQNSEVNRAALGCTKLDDQDDDDDDDEAGIDCLLRVIDRCRKRKNVGDAREAHASDEEEEFVENVVDALCSCLSLVDNKMRFLQGEGVELIRLLLASTDKSIEWRRRAIKLLDHASSGPSGSGICLRFVLVNGLGPLFSVLMQSRAKKSTKKGLSREDIEHVLGILCSLLTHLPRDSVDRYRLLTKFVSKGYEKVDRLIEIRESITSRLDAATTNLTQDEEDDEDEVYLTKLEAGLFSLQLLDTVLAWLVMEDDGVKDHLAMLLRRQGLGFSDLTATLKEYRDNLGDQVSLSAVQRGDEQGEITELKTRDILTALIDYLGSIL